MLLSRAVKAGDIVAGRYEIERLAGQGGMGQVYRARDLRNGGHVALKFLLAANADSTARFAREAGVLASLDHAAIVHYVGHGRAPTGETFLAMEWLDGEDLSARLAQGPLSLAETLEVALRVAGGIGHAHSRGVIHRDVKPGNIFLRDALVSQAMVVDFGIARVGPRGVAGTRTGAVIGTPGYLAPEQARGARDIDARVDVFALGAVLFECLTGEPLFVADHVIALLAKVLLDTPRRVRDVWPDAPESFDDLVAQMLAREPSERPADAGVVLASLAALPPAEEVRREEGVSRTLTLTSDEQRFVSVVLGAARDATIDAFSSTLASVPEEPSPQGLDAIASRAGASLVRLLDGSFAMVIENATTSRELATQAARCALAVRAAWSDGVVAVATGRARLNQRGILGDAIDRAGALVAAEMAQPGDPRRLPVRIDHVTAGLLDARFDVVDDGATLHLRQERHTDDVARTLLGRAVPCVGRDRELRDIEAIYDECVDEPIARAVLVTGAAGIGKSRLRDELLRRLDQRDSPPRVLMARADSHTAGSAFALAAQLIRRATGDHEGSSGPRSRERLATYVAGMFRAPDAQRVATFLAEVIGLADGPDDGPQLVIARRDPSIMHDQIQRAWDDWLAAECTRRPLVLVLEDIHWADRPSIQLLGGALRTQHDRALLVLATARPEIDEVHPRLWSERRVQWIRLDGLTRTASERLARLALGDGIDAAVIARAVAHAEGNALFLEEIIRGIAGGSSESVPESVLAMVGHRLDAVAAPTRRVLRAASVFGQTFWRGAVDALVEGGALSACTDERLEELEGLELIVRQRTSRFDGEREYAFRHALLRDAAYATLTNEDRCLAHRLAGAWLERVSEPDPLTLAQHFERGGEAERAVAWYRRAAERCLEGNDYAATITHAERAVACGAAGETLGALRALQTEAANWSGRYLDACRWGHEAIAALPEGSSAWCFALSVLIWVSSRLADATSVVDLARRLIGLDGEWTTARLIAAMSSVHQLIMWRHTDVATAMRNAVMENVAKLSDAPDIAARVEGLRATATGAVGDLLGSARSMRRVATLFELAGDRRRSTGARGNVGYQLAWLGQYGEAMPVLRVAVADSEQLGLSSTTAFCRLALGECLISVGDYAEGVELIEGAIEAFEGQLDPRMEAQARRAYAQALLLQRRTAEAEREARRAVELCEVPEVRLWTLAMLSEVLLARGTIEEALATSKRSMDALACVSEKDADEPYARRVYAEALYASGDAVGARTAIAEALRSLEARSVIIDDDAVRSTYNEAVPQHRRLHELARAWLGR